MRFDMLHSLIEWIKNNYVCPNCNSKIWDDGIELLWAAWTTVNIDIICKKCWTHALFNSQLLWIDLKIDSKKIQSIFEKIKNSSSETKITDKEIVSLNKDLKKNKINVKDLFN